MKRIYMSGEVNKDKFAIVDDQDYEYLSGMRWYLNSYGYATTRITKGLRKIAGRDDGLIPMHRVIMQPTPEEMIDHRNRNTLDNRRQNLRSASKSQNGANTGPRSGNTSGYKGVSFDGQRGLWRAYATTYEQRRDIGRFNTKHEAAIAYNIVAEELWGEFAYLNDIPEEEASAIEIETIRERISNPVVLSSRNTTGYRGIQPRNGRWRGTIAKDGTKIVLPTCDTPEEAAYIYDQFALQLYGEKARLSIIDKEITYDS